MHKYKYFFITWLLGLLLAQPSHAQYTSPAPVQDGNISDAEYSNTTSANGVDSNKLVTSANSAWYMTWDATNLYVAKTGGQNYEPNIMYLDLNPLLPVTGGSVSDGNLTGNTDYGVTPTLPFRGDVRVYFTDGYVEVRRAQGDGTWGSPIYTSLTISNTGTNREISLSWNTLTGGGTIPPSFNWQAYTVNNASGTANYRYDLAPANPGAAGTNGGATPPLEYYYTVANTASTANGAATKPFILKSYTFLGTSDNNGFGSIDVWDFTMNLPGRSISRGDTGGTWSIGGSLVVSAGTVYFGSPARSAFGDTYVGNIRMLGSGVLKMDQTNRPLNVREDVLLTGGSQFQLSGVLGGDLNVGRNFVVTNGMTAPATFQANGRTVTFTGTSVAHRIQANTNYLFPFDYLTLSSPSSTVTLDNDIAVGSLLTFNQGILNTNGHYVELYGTAFLSNETADSHAIGNVRITQSLVSNNTTGFGNVGLRLIPQNGTSMQGPVTLTRVTGTTLPGVGMGTNTNSIQRYFQLSAAGTSFASPDFLVEFAYRLDELNGIPESNLALYKSLTTANGPYARLTMPPSANTSAHTVTYRSQLALDANSFLTLADGTTPLPVTLVSFTAQATPQGAALLRWVTASEANSKGFGIERQLGAGGAWQPVGYVAAANLATGSTYSFSDGSLAAAPASANAYYRLRQEDLDGTFSYSPVAAVARPAAGLEASQLVLSPVPVSGASLSVAFAEAGQAGSAVTVTNVQGQRLLHLTTEASAADAVNVPVEKLVPGVYIVQVQVPGQPARYARFVKQ